MTRSAESDLDAGHQEATEEELIRERPPEEALRWVTDAIGDGARVSSVFRMRGGTSSAMHAINVTDAGGQLLRLVLRRYVRSGWLAEEPDVAHREGRVLRLLAGAELPAPELVAVDGDGAKCDVPAVLMTRLAGQVQFLPDDMTSWLKQLAAVLLALHSVASKSPPRLQSYRPYIDVRALEAPEWSRRKRVWERALDRLNEQAPETAPCFIHRDYHPGNVLWSRGRLSGVVDWVNASWGPAAIDVGHCRLNLAQLHGVEVADRFLANYESSAEPYDPYWDLLTAVECLPEPRVYEGWTERGVEGLSVDLIGARLDEYIESIVARL